VSDKETDLIKLPFWDKLSPYEKNTVSTAASVRHFEAGEIMGCGGGCLGLVYIKSGSLRVYMLSEEGREITLYRLHSGDTCVMSASCVISQLTFETQMTAEEDTDILVINTGVFSQLTERNIYVRCFMYELISERFSSVMWTLQEILFKGFDRRLAAFFVREYDRTGSAEIRMTHEQIAQKVNSAREVVARMVKRFSEDGLVEARRGVIRLTDIAALREM